MKHRFFENSFFPATITEWNDLDYSLCNAPSINVFKKNILKFTRFGLNKVFNIYNLHGLKLLTRLHLDLSHLRGHKFNHNFSHCLDEICMCGKDIESTNLSSFNVPYLLMKSKYSWIKFVILTAHLLTKMKTLSVIHFFLVKKTWMTAKTPIFLRQQ